MKTPRITLAPHALPIAAAILLTVISLLSAGAKDNTQVSRNSNAAKAKDLYVEALQAREVDDLDACVNLLDYAYSLNPDDNDIKFEHGFVQAVVMAYVNPDAAKLGVTHMKEVVADNPANTEYALRLISIMSKLRSADTTADELMAILSHVYQAASDRSLVAGAYASLLRSSNNADSIRKSIAILDSLEYVEGPSQQLTSSKMQAYISLGDTVTAMNQIRKLYLANPDVSDNLMLMALTSQAFGMVDSADYWFDRGIELFPDMPDFYMRKAVSHEESTDTVGLIDVLCTAMASPDLDFDTKEQMMAYFAQETFADNTGMLLKPMEIMAREHPDRFSSFINYAMIAVAAGDTVTAQKQLANARALDPTEMAGYSMSANLYNTAGELDSAIAVVNAGIKSSDMPLVLRQYKSFLYVDNDQYAPALKVVDGLLSDLNRTFNLEKALAQRSDTIVADTVEAIEPDRQIIDTLAFMGELYLSKGDILLKLERPKEAIPAYEKAIQIRPDDWLVYNNYSYMLADRNMQLDRALELAEKSLEIVNNDDDLATHYTSIADTYAWVLFRRGELLKARQYIDETLEIDSAPSAEVLDHAGDIYHALGLFDEAAEFWKQALQLEPDNAAIRKKYEKYAKPDSDE